jgi:hypothetical protein
VRRTAARCRASQERRHRSILAARTARYHWSSVLRPRLLRFCDPRSCMQCASRLPDP